MKAVQLVLEWTKKMNQLASVTFSENNGCRCVQNRVLSPTQVSEGWVGCEQFANRCRSQPSRASFGWRWRLGGQCGPKQAHHGKCTARFQNYVYKLHSLSTYPQGIHTIGLLLHETTTPNNYFLARSLASLRLKKQITTEEESCQQPCW